jgi:hypothetical protein
MPKYGKIPTKTLLFSGAALVLLACGGGSSKRVYFGNLEDGSNVESPFKVDMKAENLIVEPSTMGVTEGHGHFHIIVDASLASPSEPMSKDAKHIHYGAGEMETVLDLPLGQHTLILQFAKGDHVPYDPPVYQQITVNVTKVNTVVDTTAKKADTSAVMGLKPGTADSLKATGKDSIAVKTDTAGSKETMLGKPGEKPVTKEEANKHEGHKKEKVLPKK